MGCFWSCAWADSCLRQGQESRGQSWSGKLSSACTQERTHGPSYKASEPWDDVLELPNFSSSKQTHEPIPWFKFELNGITAARLTASWADQGWGNRKGAIHARVTTETGSNKTPYPWRRIGPYPAPHGREQVDIPLPEEFFSDVLPDDAQLELGCEVGGGGGHSLQVWGSRGYNDSAKVEIQRRLKVLFANFVEDQTAVHLSDLGGTVVAVVDGVTVEDARDVIVSSIREAIARQMPGEHFKVMIANTESPFDV